MKTMMMTKKIVVACVAGLCCWSMTAAGAEKKDRQDAAAPRDSMTVGELRDHVKLLQGDFVAYRGAAEKARAAKLRAVQRAAVELRAMVLDTSFADEGDRTEALRLLSEIVEALGKVAKDRALEEKIAELLGDCVTALDAARDQNGRERQKLSQRHW